MQPFIRATVKKICFLAFYSVTDEKSFVSLIPDCMEENKIHMLKTAYSC